MVGMTPRWTKTLFVNSCHHPSVFRGIVLGELHRLRLTNSSKHTFEQQVHFFFRKLALRGYPSALLEDARAKVQYENRFILSREPSQHKLVFAIPYVSGAQHLHLAGILKRNWPFEHATVMVAYTTGRNLFQKRFARFRL